MVALSITAQTIDRHDAGMLEPPGDLGLEQEAEAAVRVIGAFRRSSLAQPRDSARSRGPRRSGPAPPERAAEGLKTARQRPANHRHAEAWPRGRYWQRQWRSECDSAWRRERDRPGALTRREWRRGRPWPPGSSPRRRHEPPGARQPVAPGDRAAPWRGPAALPGCTPVDFSRTQACIAAIKASSRHEVHLHRQDPEEQVAVGIDHTHIFS